MSPVPEKLTFKNYWLPEDAVTRRRRSESGGSSETYSVDSNVQLEPVSESDDSSEIYSDESIVQLEQIKVQERVKKLPGTLASDLDNPIFGELLDWAYRGYIVHRQSALRAGYERDGPFSKEPSQPIDRESRRKQVQEYQSGESCELCLFNVIVALEWYPTKEYMRQLKWGFRRASDFLYDVTDGRMAFGQVVFGGQELMHCADVQILASNQLHPRSWVGGLHNEKKYTPICIGRGTWPSRNGVSIPWDEPEAYRTLIHEWGHYALELRDQYFERRQLICANDAGISNVHRQVLVRAKGNEPALYIVVIPKQSTASESIMTTLEGTSELVPRTTGNSVIRKSKEWEQIKQRYDWLTPPPKPLEGPGRLPLPLPLFRQVGKLAASSQSDDLVLRASELGVAGKLKRFSVYIVRYTDQRPKRIIAQGSPDARFQDDGLRLLGAQAGDTIVVAGADQEDKPTVYCGKIVNTSQQDGQLVAKVEEWVDATPYPFPTIDVVPDEILPDREKDTETIARISVCVSANSTEMTLPDNGEVWVFPLGRIQNQNKPLERDTDGSNTRTWKSQVCKVPTLDGHVLVRWGEKLVILYILAWWQPAKRHTCWRPPNHCGID